MPPKKKGAAAKRATTAAPKTRAGGASKTEKAGAAAAAKKQAAAAALWAEVDAQDPLLERATTVRASDLFKDLSHRTFKLEGEASSREFDWGVLKAVLAARDASSPRWFMQLREEDLLAGEQGMEGIKMDCFVVAEATQPTMAPAEYIVRVHYPFSDLEDNAPERVRPLAEQGMCWREVVKDDGSPTNIFFLQRREVQQFSFGGGGGGSASAPPSAPPAGFSFGTSATTASASATANKSENEENEGKPPTSFSFGFGAAGTSAAGTAASPGSFSFSFGGGGAPGSAPAAGNATSPPSFSFGGGSSAGASVGSATAAAAAASAKKPDLRTAPVGELPAPAAPTHAPVETAAAMAVSQLRARELNFVLWSTQRLKELRGDILSGSRVVRPDFPFAGVKLQMQNDREDDPAVAARAFLLSAFFAPRCGPVAQLDRWMEQCPSETVGEHDEGALESLMQALAEVQAAREALLAACAGDDEDGVFAAIEARYGAAVRAELEYMVSVRRAAADAEVARIDAILALIKGKRLAEKSHFRLLKYYPKNDVKPFRPTDKISGITEAGERADECIPPPPVRINPFTGKPM